MMRDLTSSRWYIPLVASTEVVRLGGDLTVIDPSDTIGTLPDPVSSPQDDAVLWLDSATANSVFRTDAGGIYRVRDLGPNGNHALQSDVSLRPTLDSGPGLDFRG
jgi:hypothetical protein